MSSTTYPEKRSRLMSFKKGNLLLGALCCIPLLHALLLFLMTDIFLITDPNALEVMIVNFLRPVGVIGAMIVFMWSAYHERGYRRWAWICQVAAMVCSVVFTTLLIIPWRVPGALVRILAIMIYLLGLGTITLYLKSRTSELGNFMRVAMGGVTVGFSMLIFTASILPRMLPNWEAPLTLYTANFSFTIGIFFAVLIVATRERSGIHIPILLASLGCLLVNDLINLVPAWQNSRLVLSGFSFSLTTLHNILLSVVAYRSVVVKQLPEQHPTEKPLRDWLLWTSLPLAVVLATFFAASLAGQTPFILLLPLALFAVMHEALAALDYRRVLNNLQSSNQQLAAAKEQAQAEAATTESFLIRLIHDLAPPVQGLLTVVNFSAAWREEQCRFQELAAKQVGLLKRFIEQARAYLQVRTFSLAKTDVVLLPICLDAVEAASLLAQPRSVQIVQEILVDTPALWGDETAIRRILDNLLTNAVRISPQGGEVILSVTRPAPDQVQIAVTDQGPGISPEKQVYLFKPYAALQNLDGQEHPSPTGTGLGLGLAIVKELTTALGGMCGVHSTPGAGSTFYVRLPLRPLPSATPVEA